MRALHCSQLVGAATCGEVLSSSVLRSGLLQVVGEGNASLGLVNEQVGTMDVMYKHNQMTCNFRYFTCKIWSMPNIGDGDIVKLKLQEPVLIEFVDL